MLAYLVVAINWTSLEEWMKLGTVCLTRKIKTWKKYLRFFLHISRVTVQQICILSWRHLFIFCFTVPLAAVTPFERRHFHVWLVFIHCLLQTKCDSTKTGCVMFFFLAGELETWCVGSWDEDGHRDRHLYCVCRNHHPWVCCLKSLHWGSCVWGITFTTIIICSCPAL